jgi:hypothetical protein
MEALPMLRTLLGAVILLALPALLNAQAPAARHSGSDQSAVSHGVATQIQGDVVEAQEFDGQNNHEGIEETDGDNNQEGVDEPAGSNHEDGINEVDSQGNDETAGEAGTGHDSQAARMGSHRP